MAFGFRSFLLVIAKPAPFFVGVAFLEFPVGLCAAVFVCLSGGMENVWLRVGVAQFLFSWVGLARLPVFGAFCFEICMAGLWGLFVWLSQFFV